MYQNICWGHQSLQSQLIKLIIRVKAAILQSVSKQLSVLWCCDAEMLRCWDAKTHIFTFACITHVNVCFRDKEKKEGEEETLHCWQVKEEKSLRLTWSESAFSTVMRSCKIHTMNTVFVTPRNFPSTRNNHMNASRPYPLYTLSKCHNLMFKSV